MRCLLLVVLVGCYSPRPQEGAQCGAGSACPSGLVCASDNTCVLPGHENGIDAPETRDAAIDAMPDARPDAFSGCALPSQTMSAPCTGTFSSHGMWFDIEAKVPLSITSFDTVSQNGGTDDVAVYVRSTTANGNEQSANGWTLLGTKTGFIPTTGTACPLTPTPIPITFCVDMVPGDRFGFYIAVTAQTAGNGTLETGTGTTGTITTQNADLILYSGRATLTNGAFPAAAPNADQAFQGVIHYKR